MPFAAICGCSNGFLNECGDVMGFESNFREEIRKIEQSNLERNNSKLGQFKPLFVILQYFFAFFGRIQH